MTAEGRQVNRQTRFLGDFGVRAGFDPWRTHAGLVTTRTSGRQSGWRTLFKTVSRVRTLSSITLNLAISF